MKNGYDFFKKINYENAQNQNERKLFYEKHKFFGFKNITEERKKEIEEKAQLWASQNKDFTNKQKLFSLYYLLNKEYKINLNLEENDECYLFLIYAFDPELKLLQISYEETKVEEIKRRFQEEFQTYYDSRLLQIETYYNKRFPTIIDEFDKKI